MLRALPGRFGFMINVEYEPTGLFFGQSPQQGAYLRRLTGKLAGIGAYGVNRKFPHTITFAPTSFSSDLVSNTRTWYSGADRRCN